MPKFTSTRGRKAGPDWASVVQAVAAIAMTVTAIVALVVELRR